MSERNEREHKDLIKMANDGAEAIVKLRQRYDDLTEVQFEDGSTIPISDIVTPDHEIGKFKER